MIGGMMSKYIDIAKRFVQEKLRERDDIVGVLLVGSAARGEETPFSDIDVRVVVQSQDGKRITRDGLDTWIDGIYIDAGFVDRNAYSNVTHILAHPITANNIHDAIILHDPEGLLAMQQEAIRAVFMQPQWVGMRLKPNVESLPARIKALHDAIASNEPVDICIHTGRIAFSFGLIPLIRHGVSPSSTRSLIQLGTVDEGLKQRLCELEGTAELDNDTVSQALSLFAQLTNIADTEKWGALPAYVVKKVEWMSHNGFPQEALHTAWFNCGFRIKDCLDARNHNASREMSELVKHWLQTMGWQGDAVLKGKLELLTSIWKEIEASTARYIAAAQE
jgi:hypothetical protein